MATIDVTGASGQKPSSSSRSQTASFKEPVASVRSQDFARTTLVRKPATGTALGALAGSLGDFFQSQIGPQQQREEAAAKEENRQEAMRIQAAVSADRAGAREAMISGDTTGFVSPHLRSRKVVAEAFESISAQAMAEDDFNNDLKERIQSLPITEDPEAFLQGYLKSQMKGGSPTFQTAYSQTLSKAAAREIADFRKGRVVVAEKRAEEAATAAITLDLQNLDAPVTPKSLQLMSAKITASLPSANGPKRALIAEAIRDRVVTKFAAEKGGAYLKMLEMPDPERDGTSIADRNPGAYEKARSAAINKFKSTLSLEAQTTYDDVENQLSSYLATGQGDVGDLYIQMQRAGQKYGKHATEWQSLRDKFTKTMAGAAVNRGTFASIANGNASNVGNSVYAKIAPLLRQPATWEETAKQTGVPVAAVRSRMMREYGVRGPGKAGVQAASATLLTSPDHNQIKELFEESEFFINERSVRMDDPDTGHYTPEAYAVLSMMHLAKASGMDPYAERQKYLDRLGEAGGRLKIQGHYRNRKDARETDGETIGPAGEAKMARDVWDNLDLPDRGDIDEVKIGVRNAITEAVDMASAVTQGQGKLGNKHIMQLASNLLRNNFVQERGTDGERRYTFDLTPPMVLDTHNNLVRGDKMNSAVLDRLDASLETPENKALTEILGGGMGAAVDKDTRAGFGLGVISNTKGFDEEVRFQAGKRFGVDFQNIPANFPLALIEMIKVDPSMDPTGDMIFETPPAPKNGEPITKSLTPNLFLLYERKTDQWTMRWKDEGAPSTNPSEVSARNKARRSAMTAARPKSTHTQFKATIGQVGPLEADKPIGERSTSLSGVVSDLTAEIDKSLVPPVQGTRGPIGSAVPDEDTENPPNEHETVALDAIVEEILSSMTGSNFVGEVAVSDESKTHDASEDGASVEDRLQAVVDQEQANGGKLDSIREPNNKSFDNSLRDFITNEEGYVPMAYDDHSKTRAAWTSKSTGDPTIGHGFNLKRPDARAMLKRVGADFDKVMARKQSLTKLQADHLYKLSVEPLVTLVRKKYAGANLGNHQIQALVSLAYNSRWNAEGPTLLGPKLSQAIADKDWIAAGFEIAHNSENVPDNIRRGIHLRRIKEATLFLGPSLAKQVTYLN